jgi:prepilin-type N-terminal cleavage/methylation domain-containing protein
MMVNRLNRRGFTLVELAIVLVVIGLLVGLGMKMVGPLMTSIKIRESRETVGGGVDTVNSWAAGSYRLPPAVPTAPDTSRFDQIAKKSTDAWGRSLVYLYDANLAPTGGSVATKDTICGRRTTTLSVITADPVTTINNIAYAVVSSGEDGPFQTKLNGTLNGAAAANVLLTVSGYATGTITQDPADTTDILRWVTLDELRTKMGCQGAQLKIVNNEVPYGTVAAVYPAVGRTVALSVDGGATPGTLRWCVEAPSLTPLPSGIAFAPALAGAIRVAPNSCNGTTPLAEASWISSATLTISGTPAAGSQGSYLFTIYVRDNNDAAGSNDNVASKSFVMTINP